MSPLSPDVQAALKPLAEHWYVFRRFCIPVALAAAVGFGYVVIASPKTPGLSLADVGLIGSVIVFLVLLVSVLGDQLKRTPDRERSEVERNTDA
jgi:hypothetical protein